MRSLTFVAQLFIAATLFGANDSPFLRLELTTKNGNTQVIGKNTSLSPIVAYVVVANRAHQRAVWKSVYSAGDTLGIGKSVLVGDVPAGQPSDSANVFVDYVRLADGSTWGDAETEEARETAARFRK